MGTLISRNKREKEKNIHNAAYELFIEVGFENTTVDQIAKKAGVAKGTFYLYFKDKHDLLNKIVLKKSHGLAKEALEKTREEKIEVFEESILFFTNYVIEYFKENQIMLKVIKKNFVDGLYKEVDENDEEIRKILEIFIEKLKARGYTEKEGKLIIYMIVELVGSVAYNAIILKKPCDIDEIKPMLFKSIRGIVKNEELKINN
ncbi:MAG: TetR/AcrR family transcriptional regulator [Clostridium sp.]|uniref:TetR/AcrR family transcriptional regulator n=1 Tax=Clostridium sp. TaxID=1506 RepID=UPI003F2EF60F